MRHLRSAFLATASTLVLLMALGIQAAGADNYGSSTHQHTSLWNYYTNPVCVAIGEDTLHTSYPTNTWYSSVGVTTQSGSLSWSASIAGYVGISYTPSPACNDAFAVNYADLVVHGDLYKWNGSAWYVCQVNPGGVYGSYWANNTSVTWGFKVQGDPTCGAGWYYSDGTGQALVNGAWRGYEPYLTNAGPSGPIWMD